MKRITFALVLVFALAGIAYAYNCRGTVTKESESKLNAQFLVTFDDHGRDDMVSVTVTVPQKIANGSLAELAIIQIENNKTTLRIPISIACIAMPDKNGKLEMTRINPEVRFEVSQTRLADTWLEVRYSSDIMNGWTYDVDLKTYQPQKKRSAQRPSDPKLGGGIGDSQIQPAMNPASSKPADTVQPPLCDVVITGVADGRKITAIKAVREITGLGLKDAKDLVEKTPSVVKQAVSKAEAESIAAKLRESSLVVEIKKK